MTVTTADLQAVGDVLDWVAEESDSMTIEEAMAVLETLVEVGKKLAMAKALCETQIKTLLDGQPAKVGDKIVVERQTGKWRPDQGRIKRRVVGMAGCDPSTGELRTGPQAAEAAVDLMYALFVSPSQMPKQGGMQKLGIDTPDIAEWEITGSELKVIDA